MKSVPGDLIYMQDRQADPYGRGSYCIVVTLHGDESREAEVLREFRDRYLEKLPMGDRLVELYYRASPAVCSVLERNSRLETVTSSFVSSLAGMLSVSGL